MDDFDRGALHYILRLSQQVRYYMFCCLLFLLMVDNEQSVQISQTFEVSKVLFI